MAVVVVTFVVMGVGVAADRGLDWAVDPVGWLILVVVTVPMVVIVMDRNVAAGADWVRRGRKWVDVYALDEIHAEYDGGTVSIRLTDSHRRWVRVAGRELVPVPVVWALAFNGMRHSAAAGARLSGDAVYGLGLGSPSQDVTRTPVTKERGPCETPSSSTPSGARWAGARAVCRDAPGGPVRARAPVPGRALRDRPGRSSPNSEPSNRDDHRRVGA